MSWGQLVLRGIARYRPQGFGADDPLQRKWYALEMNRPAIKDAAIVTLLFTSMTASKTEAAGTDAFAPVAKQESQKCLFATPPCFRTVFADFLPHGSQRQMKRRQFTQGIEG